MRQPKHRPAPAYRPGHRPSRHGFTIVELTIAFLLLAICWGIVAPLMIQLGKQRRAAHRDQQALLVAENVVDELTSCPLDELPARMEAVQQRTQARLEQDFPGVEVIVTDDVIADDVPGRSVVCHIRWNDERRHPLNSVAITGWNIPVEGGEL